MEREATDAHFDENMDAPEIIRQHCIHDELLA